MKEKIKKTKEDRILDSLTRLNRNPDFHILRDKQIKPSLIQLENDLKNADKFSEPVLRGKLKHYFSMKNQYYDIFENIKLIRNK